MVARVAWLGIAVCVALISPAHAEEWGGIAPGTTLKFQVRERFGAPSREVKNRVEQYDTIEWLYEQGKAPAGIRQMQVQFGLLTPRGFNPDVVRALTLTPRSGVFTRRDILTGWGQPDRIGAEKEKGQRIFIYNSGLVVLFDKNEQLAETLLFSPPQSEAPSK
jgi:hypothetical protein